MILPEIQLRSAMRPGFRTMLAGALSDLGAKDPLIPLSDTFDTLDAAKWTASNTNGTVSIVSGALDLTTTGAAGSHATVTSVTSFDLRARAAYMQVVRPYLGTVDADGGRLIFRIQDSVDAQDYVEWFIQTNGLLVARTCDNGTPTNNTEINLDWATSGFKWLKISLNAAGTTATWWTAPDSGSGTPGAWTSRLTYSSLPSTFASAKAKVWVENWGTGHGAITQSGRIDGFNTVAG